ncbi:MAG: zinc-binding dehydrogenase, partial [Candidatus Latescibacterota bacterium]
ALKLGVDEMASFTPGKESYRASADIVEAVQKFTGGGADVAMEMAGYNSSVNNAIQSVRRGGDVVLFGLKGGRFTIQDFSRIIVRGITLHSVIGRRIFETWMIGTNLLEAKDNQVQDKIFNVILDKGQDTIVHIDDYDIKEFEKKILAHPKVIIQW